MISKAAQPFGKKVQKQVPRRSANAYFPVFSTDLPFPTRRVVIQSLTRQDPVHIVLPLV